MTSNTCLFCDIVAHRQSAEIIFEDDFVCMFLDKTPLFPGHTLIVPKQHCETLTDLPQELLAPFFTRLQRLSQVVKVAMNAQGSFVAINNTVSQSVPHAHFHVVPRTKGDGLKGFFWPRQKYREGQTTQVGALLRKTWQDFKPTL